MSAVQNTIPCQQNHSVQDEEVLWKDGSKLYNLFQWQIALHWYFPTSKHVVGRTPMYPMCG